MVGRLDKVQLLARDEVVPAPGAAWQDYDFEMPPGLNIATAALLLGFVSVLSLAFANPGMAVPFGICLAFLGTFFSVPTIFAASANVAWPIALRRTHARLLGSHGSLERLPASRDKGTCSEQESRMIAACNMLKTRRYFFVRLQ